MKLTTVKERFGNYKTDDAWSWPFKRELW